MNNSNDDHKTEGTVNNYSENESKQNNWKVKCKEVCLLLTLQWTEPFTQFHMRLTETVARMCSII